MGSGASKPSQEQLEGAHVVIIGCGYAGLHLASELKKAGVKFTLIEPKEYFHHCVAALRAAVDPTWVARTAIPLNEAFRSSYLQGRAVALDQEEKVVTLEDGQRISFSHCVISVGSLGPHPARSCQVSVSELESDCRDLSEAVTAAKNILIVGGGPVGVELAGEIVELHNDKSITIVSASEKLVTPDFDEKFQNCIKWLIEQNNVKIKIGKVTNLTDLQKNTVTQQTVEVGDEKIEADLVISCVGLPPNRDSISKLVTSDQIDENGRIKVNEFLQVPGLSNIFAVGDCCNTDEHKMAAFAGAHGDTVAKNILQDLMGGPPSPYKRPFVGMLVPFGRSAGAGMFNGFHIPSFVGARLKYGGLFTEKYWTMAGLKVPQ